jgi:hypothetical protein
MADHKRQQSKDLESQNNTRQDRNTFLTDGGTWTWDSGTGTLTWSGIARVRRGGYNSDAIAPGSVTGMTSAGDCAYVDVNRTAGGGALTLQAGVAVGSNDNRTDERLIIGARGADAKFYFRNGTVMSDGDSKAFGQLNPATDRNDITANGLALQTVGFTFAAGTSQLAVYVGGILQTLGVEYVETGTTQVTFQAGYIPTAGEAISFVNIIGGEGPAATGTVTLQDAWANGNEVDVSSGDPVLIYNPSAVEALYIHDTSPVVGFPNFSANSDGNVIISAGDRGYNLRDNLGTDYWAMLPLDNGTGSLFFLNSGGTGGLAFSKAASLLEFGTYTGAFPGGTWAGDGGLRWKVEDGTLNAGAPTSIAIGAGLTILGVSVAIFDSGTSLWQLQEFGSATDATRQFFVTYNEVSGDLTISGSPNGTGAPGSGIDGEAYRIAIFHQG